MEQAPRYEGFVLVVVPSDESFDLAISEMDNGRRFLLTPGMRIVAVAPNTSLAIDGPKVLAAKPLTDGSLSILTALSPGHSRVLSHYTGPGTGFDIDVLVRPAGARYDAVVSNQDAGRTIHAKVGQTIQFRLVETAGYSRWVSDSWGFFLLPVTNPSADQNHNAWITYEVVAAYRMSLQFREVPDCYGQRSCQLPWRVIAFDVVANA